MIQFALVVASILQGSQDTGEGMLRLVTADQPLIHTVTVDAPVKEVWKAYTTTSGITSWMVPKGEIALRVGGYIRTSYSKQSTLTGPDVIENTILAFDPEKMLSMKCTRLQAIFHLRKQWKMSGPSCTSSQSTRRKRKLSAACWDSMERRSPFK